MTEENKTITEPLKITPNSSGSEVGTIKDAELVDESITPITAPPTVSDEEAETYKTVEDKLTSAPDDVDWETEAVEKAAELIDANTSEK